MNICHDEHYPQYKITYKSNSIGGIDDEWLVCEECFGKQEFFGIADEIKSIVSLRTHRGIQLEIDNLSIMTRTVSRKLKKSLLVH